MQLTFYKENILKSIQVLQSVSSTRSTLPILSHILIRAKGKKIEMVATDLEVGIRINIEGEIAEEGATTVPAKQFVEIIRELPASTGIKLSSTENEWLSLECGSGVYKIVTSIPEEFPPVPSLDGNDSLKISGDLLRSMLGKTEFAASTEETRYYLNGLYFNLTAETTEVVGTDGRRLSIVSAETLNSELENPVGVIVPIKAVKEVGKTFADSEEVTIAVQENHIIFADEDSTLSSRLIDGDYPQYDRIIPKEEDNPIKIVADVSAISGALTRVAIFSNPKSRMTRWTADGKTLSISAKSAEFGEATETVIPESFNDSIEIGFDAQFVKDVLSHVDTDKIVMNLKDPLSAVTFSPVDVDDESESHRCLIMPMRLDN